MDSKYYTTWEEYKEKHPEVEMVPEEAVASKIEKYEDALFDFVISLLI